MTTTTVEREFTELGDLTVEFMPTSHRYALIKDGERVKADSPTGALSVLRQEWAIPWAENLTASAMLELARDGAFALIEPSEAAARMRALGFGPRAKRDAGADRGTAIHTALEQYCTSGKIPSLSDYDPEVRGFVSGLCSWLVEASPEPLLTEQIVGSWEHRLAGRFDLLAVVNNEEKLIDLKTGARGRVYPEHHLQTAAYLQLLAESSPYEASYLAGRGLIVAVGEDASVQATECKATWDQFACVLACSRTMREVKAATK